MSTLQPQSSSGTAKMILKKMRTPFLSERKSRTCMRLDVFITRWGRIYVVVLLLNNGLPRSIMILYLLQAKQMFRS